MKHSYILDLIKNLAQSDRDPSLSVILNNTKAVPQTNKKNVQHPHYRNKINIIKIQCNEPRNPFEATKILKYKHLKITNILEYIVRYSWSATKRGFYGVKKILLNTGLWNLHRICGLKFPPSPEILRFLFWKESTKVRYYIRQEFTLWNASDYT